MYTHEAKQKLQNIISGTYINWQNDRCTNARNYLCGSFTPNTTVKKDFNRQSAIKKEQAESLNQFITGNNWWLNPPSQLNRFLTQGGEAEIYFNIDEGYVTKLNDAIYYATWLDFLSSILIHNLLFEETRYELQGFTTTAEGMQAVLKQNFIISDSPVNLREVKSFLEFNGFKNTKRNDYYNEELGLILEDIHDENVIMNSGVMFFIDTVFFVDK